MPSAAKLEKLLLQLEDQHQKMIEEIRGYIDQGHIETMSQEQLERLRRIVNEIIQHAEHMKTLKSNLKTQ